MCGGINKRFKVIAITGGDVRLLCGAQSFASRFVAANGGFNLVAKNGVDGGEYLLLIKKTIPGDIVINLDVNLVILADPGTSNITLSGDTDSSHLLRIVCRGTGANAIYFISNNPSLAGLVTSVNGNSGNVTITAASIGALTAADLDISVDTKAANYTLILSDNHKLVQMDSAIPANITVPPEADQAFPVGAIVNLSSLGAALTSVVAGAGVTIRSAGGALNLRTQYSAASLIKIDADIWLLTGDIAVAA